mgnify:CR=1 FL=1
MSFLITARDLFFVWLELFEKLTFLFGNKNEKILQYSPIYKYLNCLIAKQELFLIIEAIAAAPIIRRQHSSLDAWNFLFGGD